MAGPPPEDLGFDGYWEQRGMVKVPVIPDDRYQIFDFGPPEPGERPVERPEHVPSHQNYMGHLLAGDTPCTECAAAERMYQHNRRQR